jgi:acetolactate synthase-1/2/3 large subunit
VNHEKYSDCLIDWLSDLGYTHCFFLAGGNIMHLLHSASQRMTCVPFSHEVTAGIAAEYFNELNQGHEKKAFVLVTAGPGLTNLVTAIAGAYLESRELLILGGQVKTQDLSTDALRQRGIQEVNGSELISSITKVSETVSEPLSELDFKQLVSEGFAARKGPVFLEIPLDVQGRSAHEKITRGFDLKSIVSEVCKVDQSIFQDLAKSSRPILLLGGGLSRKFCEDNYSKLQELNIPVMTTWNGADRYGSSEKNYWGRPNTWGQRYSNILIQQSDFIVAVGTRLGLQQTGFNWENFAPGARIVQVDIDSAELQKGHPKVSDPVCLDADQFLGSLLNFLGKNDQVNTAWSDWLKFGQTVKDKLPLSESANKPMAGYINPYDFIIGLSSYLDSSDVVVPSSSGSSMTVTMQSLLQPRGCRVVTNKSLASMGYGLGGAIGACLSTKSRVIHIEGDGGYLQNIQDLGTMRRQQLPIKTFIFSNGGYASIRMTQLSYFNGQYVGCDEATGLALPNWELLASSFGVKFYEINPKNPFDSEVISRLESPDPEFFLVPISQEQTYYPKITSRVSSSGSMESNPLHLMTPDLDPILFKECYQFH